MSLYDTAGLVGVILMLGAYAAAQFHLLDTTKPIALGMNLGGSSLVMLSLIQKFNLAAFVMELAWALVAAGGLVRLAVKRFRGRSSLR